MERQSRRATATRAEEALEAAPGLSDRLRPDPVYLPAYAGQVRPHPTDQGPTAVWLLFRRRSNSAQRPLKRRSGFHRLNHLQLWQGAYSILDDGYSARPTGRRALDLVREAADDEAVARKHFEIVQLFKVAIADITARLVAFPDERGITRL